jgi:uncharacterized protein YukE
LAQFLVNMGELGSLISELQTQQHELEGRLQAIQSLLVRTDALGWSGSSSSLLLSARDTLERSSRQSLESLRVITDLLSTARQAYEEVDAQIASRFDG